MNRTRRGAGAAALAAALALVPRLLLAGEPNALPDPLWWRDRPPAVLAREPLGALAATGSFDFRSEWAPLYSGRGDARIERASRWLRVASRPAPWRVAAEASGEGAVARGGQSAWWVGAERPFTTGGTLALSRHGRALALAAALSDRGAGAGVAAGLEVRPLPALVVTLGGARLPESGRVHVRWEDIEVFADGRWRDAEARGSLAWAGARGAGIALAGRLLDRRAPDTREGAAAGTADRVAPRLAWREGSLHLAARALGTRWGAALETGAGDQDLTVARDGTPYLELRGPVSSALATLSAEPARAPIVVRAWAGRWRGNARGSLVLWPFDGLAGLTGTRRLAASSASLEHWGVSIDRRPRAGVGLDGGLAIWSLAPRAGYSSWQGSWLGLVRTDASGGEAGLRSVLALGGRLAAGISWSGVLCRIEAIQWAPVWTVRAPGAGGTGAGSGSGGTGATSGRDSGGTILRLSFTPER